MARPLPVQEKGEDVLLLGEIVATGFRRESQGGATADEVWLTLDGRYRRRWDYALFRLAVLKEPISQLELPTFEACVESGLSCNEHEQVWGVVVVLSGLLTRKFIPGLSRDQSEWGVSKLQDRLRRPMRPVRHTESGCALARLLALSAVDKVRFQSGSVTASIADLRDFVGRVERLVGQVDPAWRPGRWVSLKRLANERRLFVSNFPDLAMRLGSALFNVRGTVRAACASLLFEEGMDDLLRRVARLSFSAWRMARLRGTGRQSKRDVEHELTALQHASQAAWDAGDLLTFGRLAALLLYSVPVKDRGRFMPIARSVSFDLRELGLTVPSWYSTRGRERQKDDPTSAPSEIEPGFDANKAQPTNGSAMLKGTGSAKTVSRPNTTVVLPFYGRLIRESERDEDWLLVAELATDQEIFGPPLERLHKFAVRGCRRPEILGAATESVFRLLCRYRRLRTLFRLLDSPTIAATLANRENLLLLATTLFEGMSTLPLILNQEEYHKWRFKLGDFWALIPPAECADERDIYQLHETVLGRGLTFTRAMSAEAGEINWRAYQETFTEDELGALLDSDVRFIHAAQRGNLWGIGALRHSLSAAPYPILFVSVAMLGSHAQEFSVTAFKKFGLGFVDRSKDESWHLIREAKEVAAVHTHNVRIAWPHCSGLEAIAAKVIEAGETLRIKPSWIVLAIEPGLARVPWQDLLMRLGFLGGVALVPSAEWLQRATHPSHERTSEESVEVVVPLKAERFAKLSNGRIDHSAVALCDELRDDFGRLRKNFQDAVFLLSHGTWDRGRRLTVFHESAEPNESEPASPYLPNIANKEIVVLHACSAGHVVLKTLGDFDGVAAACLARRTRAFIAPIVKVTAETARSFHRYLAEPAPATLGERYLSALREDRRVSLYTYYGLPWLSKSVDGNQKRTTESED